MDIKQLNYFITIVEEGNISKAAKKLYMSQPPLSNQMILLEQELNAKLFERGTRQIVLTECGKILYERAKNIVMLSKYTKQEIYDINNNFGEIRIGVISSVSYYFEKEILKEFSLSNPNIRFQIFEENTYNLLERLENKTIELAIVRMPFETKLDKILLKKEKIVAYGNSSFFKNQTFTNLDELSNNFLIVYRRWKDILEKSFISADLKFNPHIIIDDARTSVLFAEDKLGIAIVPESILSSKNCNSNNIRIISDLDIETNIYVLYNSKIFNSKYTKRFIDFIKNKEI